MHIPQGFTQQEVMEAARRLPEPNRYARETGNPTMRVAVHETMRCSYRDYQANCMSTARMRVLRFELNNILDFRSDTLLYFWTLVGEG